MSDRGRGTFDTRLEVWGATLRRRALHDDDRAAVDATATLRALIVEHHERAGAATAGPLEPDLASALVRFGRCLAESGASPTLASFAAETLAVESAAAAVIEGYVGEALARARDEERRRWEYPACACASDGRTTIIAGYPVDDAEAVEAWASRTASALARANARRVMVGGDGVAARALLEALRWVGVEASHAAAPPFAGGSSSPRATPQE